MIKILTLALVCLVSYAIVPHPNLMVMSNQHLQLTSIPTLVSKNLPFDTQYYFDKVV